MLFGVGCTPEGNETVGDESMAEITVSPTSFATDLEGGEQVIAVTSNATWTVSCDQADVTVEPLTGNGNGQVTITVPAASAREFKVVFNAQKQTSIPALGTSTTTTAKAEVTVSQNDGGVNLDDYLFYETCGDDVEKNSQGYWPYVDQFEGWNPQGDAAANVAYKGNNASVRASGNAYQPTADAVGVSGQPYVFLNKVPASAHFVIEDIAITGGTNYIFTYNAQCQSGYSGSPSFAVVDGSLIHLELSYDGVAWAKANCTYAPNGGNGWYAVQAEFKAAGDATKLYARFTYEAPASNGGGRFDDFKLVAGGNGGELDFTVTPTPDPDPTPDPTPADAYFYESFTNGQGEFTINDVLLSGDLTYVWKHESGQYGTYMKASGYKGGATASESWLISPAISLVGATTPAVSFDHCHKFAGTPANELTLWVSENDGADWTQLVISTYGSNNDYNFVTNTTDLTAYVGKTIKLALKYVSTTSAAATWEVNNFKVAENNGSSQPGQGGGDDNIGGEASGVYTSDAAFICSKDNSTNKCYTLGDSKINGAACSGVKLGTSSNAGFFTSTAVGVEGTKTLSFYGMAWKGKSATIYIKVEGSDDIKSVAVKANDGATGNPPYTITVTDADYYSVELTGLTADSKIMFSTDTTFSTASSSAARAVLAGITLK